MSRMHPMPGSTVSTTADAMDFGANGVSVDASSLEHLTSLSIPLHVYLNDRTYSIQPATASPADDATLVGIIPATQPNRLGEASFLSDYGVRAAYATGAMANGIASADLVIAMGRAGFLAFFGAAGLAPDHIEREVARIQSALGDATFGVNLIHTPNETAWEDRVVDLLLAKQVTLIEASAYLALTPSVVRYRVNGLREEDGRVIVKNRIVAKVSRVEVASKFMAPAPQKILDRLLAEGQITAQEAELATRIPMADDITAEADSGGHTDNRPAIALLPTMIALRDRLCAEHQFSKPIRVGLAGGISTPAAALAAFSMGAAFIMTGSVNQACVESGSSDIVRQMLADAEQADVTMAPAADMFEMGVELQVLKRGTMFPMRAKRLYTLYKDYPSYDALPDKERAWVEKQVFRTTGADIWQSCVSFFKERDPRQLERAAKDPKHQMALMFRWYLGMSSRWANAGQAERKMDFQVWCGPAMGAFNEWTKETFLAQPQNRQAVTVAYNIMYGAALGMRVNLLRLLGVPTQAASQLLVPQKPGTLKEYFS